MLRASVCFAMVAGLAVAQDGPPPMAADARPTFEVATIKPSKPDEQRTVAVYGTQLRTTGTSLVDLMMFAYSVHPLQIQDGPAWMRTDRYDLVMQPDGQGRPSTAQMRAILQKLLADRFQLALHHGSKEMEVYAIVPAKRGPRLTPTPALETTEVNTAAIGFGDGAMTVRNATLAEFASLMQRYLQLEWPVVDNTHIAGKFDFKLSWTPDASQFGGNPPWPKGDNAGALDLPSAMEEQLGLNLKAMKEPTDVLVIDRVQKPSEN